MNFQEALFHKMRTFCKKGLFGPFLLTFSLRVCRQQIFFPSEIKIKIHTEFIFNNEQILYSYSWVHIWGNQCYLQIKMRKTKLPLNTQLIWKCKTFPVDSNPASNLLFKWTFNNTSETTTIQVIQLKELRLARFPAPGNENSQYVR